jgi:hypothetical protein
MPLSDSQAADRRGFAPTGQTYNAIASEANQESDRILRLHTSGVPSKCWDCHDFLTTIVPAHCEECDSLIPS